MELRDEAVSIIKNETGCEDFEAQIVWTRILALGPIKEALAFHESCKSAFKVNGEFVVTEANVVGKGGVSAS